MKVYLDGKELDVDGDSTLLEICEREGKEVPTKCHVEEMEPDARCRVCLVSMNGKLVTSCSTKPVENAEIISNSEKVVRARETNKKLMRQQKTDSEAYNLFKEVGLGNKRFGKEEKDVEEKGRALKREMEKCVNCGRCVKVCNRVQGVNAINFAGRGHETRVTPQRGKKLSEVACIRCGQCLLECEEGALIEENSIEEVEKFLEDEDKFVVAQTAPAVRSSLGELFGLEPGKNVEKEMVEGLKKLGFDKVFDTVFAADLTIVEEASELIQRVENGGPFPLITSCCPGWILYMENFHPDLRENVSSCKSPQMMLGALVKSFYAEKIGKDPEDVVVVSVMPCTSKKFEVSRIEMKDDVDAVLTTREAAQLFKKNSLDICQMDGQEFDQPLGISTGAGKIFGATGGVMEAAVRTANDKLGGDPIDFHLEEVRGEHGVKKGVVSINGKEIKFGVAHGGKNIEKTVETLEEEKFHFVEFMACPGGCVCGGGQPKSDVNLFPERAAALYIDDENAEIRRSHENPAVQKVYKDFLGEPLSEKSEEILHTFYFEREGF